MTVWVGQIKTESTDSQYIHRHNTNTHLYINNTTRTVQCRWCMCNAIDSDSVHDIRDGDIPF